VALRRVEATVGRAGSAPDMVKSRREKLDMAWRNPWTLAVPLALLAPPAALADVKAGVDAWGRGDYSLAVREWQPLAEQGDSDALFNLGQAHKLGRGVKADLAKAENLFGRAAAKGHLQAADLYGLLLFQRGERERAIPYVLAAAERGDPRAQYLLGVAHFNGDAVAKDWVRAYALTSLAQQAGVPQAKGALAQMDRFIPLEQRQQAAALAPDLASRADASRARQLAAVDLGSTTPAAGAVRVGTPRATAARPAGIPRSTDGTVGGVPRTTTVGQSTRDTAELAARIASVVADDTPRSAGADYARPQVAAVPAAPPARPQMPAPHVVATPAHPRTPNPVPAPVPSSGTWSVQLGAFSVDTNADTLWARVKGRSELAGTARRDVRTGSVTRLTAAGFRTREQAVSACDGLTAAKFSCIVVRN
jgi:cell division protein FtsN